MEIEITMETSDNRLVADILESTLSNVQVGSQKSISDGATITLGGVNRRRSIDIWPETITLVLSLGSSIAANVIGAWLYDKVKGRATTLRIDRREVHIDSGEIKKIIEETIRKYE